MYGLTEEQAVARPWRSALSVIGIIKHTADGMRSVVRTLEADMQVQGRSEPERARSAPRSLTASSRAARGTRPDR